MLNVINSNFPSKSSKAFFVLTLGIVALSFIFHTLGVSWGIPSRKRMSLVFPEAESWGKISHQLLDETKLSMREREYVTISDLPPGVQPIYRDRPVPMTEEPRRMLKIYRFYLLYAHHPDEIVVFMAISFLRPPFQMDPHFYNYGGCFLYPVGMALWISGKMGLAQVERDPGVYLCQPEEFGKFYIIGRLVVAAGVALATLFVILTGARLWGTAAGLGTGVLFALMPGIVCFVHELKPHAYGLGFVAAALYFSIRYLEEPKRKWILLSGLAAGLAAGSVPTYVFAGFSPFMIAFIRKEKGWLKSLCLSALVGFIVFILTNPYWILSPGLIREELSKPMGLYNTGSILNENNSHGLVLIGLGEAAGYAVLVAALIGVGCLYFQRRSFPKGVLTIILVPILLYMGVSVFIGAPMVHELKNARFVLFCLPGMALFAAFGLKILIQKFRYAGMILGIIVYGVTFTLSFPYVVNFIKDSGSENTRFEAGRWIAANLPVGSSVLTNRNFAPYHIPPFPLNRYKLYAIDGYPAEVVSHGNLPEYAIFPRWGEESRQYELGLLLSHYEVLKRFAPRYPSPMSFPNEEFIIYRKK